MSKNFGPSKLVREIEENVDLIINGHDHKKFIDLIA